MVLATSIFISPICSMKRRAVDYSVEEAKRQKAEQITFLGLANNCPQAFVYILSFLDEDDKDNLTLTCRYFFEKITGSKRNELGFYFKVIPSLIQNDQWRCGYFTIFNAYEIFNNLRENGAANSLLSLFKLNLERQCKFDDFYKKYTFLFLL